MLHDLFEGLEVAPAARTLLAVFAHPDDEAFTCGGSLARLADTGGNVRLLCATRGEVGEISDPALASPETLGDVRDAELRAACRELGIPEPMFLDYRDSGMVGMAANEDARSLHRAARDDVTGRVVEWIRRDRPQVVLTFDPSGGYGHPDHIAIHHATVDAFAAAADPARYPEQIADGLVPHRATRLAFIAIPHSYFVQLFTALEQLGFDPAETGIPRDIAGVPDEAIGAIAAVDEYVERKHAALLAHRTQIGESSFFSRLPRDLLHTAMAREHFIVAVGGE